MCYLPIFTRVESSESGQSLSRYGLRHPFTGAAIDTHRADRIRLVVGVHESYQDLIRRRLFRVHLACALVLCRRRNEVPALFDDDAKAVNRQGLWHRGKLEPEGDQAGDDEERGVDVKSIRLSY